MKSLRAVVIPILLLTSLLVRANDNPKQTLKSLFEQGEQCYLTDDYEQLNSCSQRYVQLFLRSQAELGDSLDVFYAYYYKMRGAYYYGMTEGNDDQSRKAESYYKACMQTFLRRNSDMNVITIREELAQLYYKSSDYQSAYAQLDTIFAYYDDHLHNLNITYYEPHYYRTLSQLAICNARLGRFDEALQQIEEAQKYFKKQKCEFYYETLRRQGKILMLQADSIGTTRYEDAKRSYERYVNEEYTSIAHRLDTMSSAHRAQHWLATHRFLYDCYRLGNHAPEMLYDLALFSKGWLIAYENDQHTPQAHWQQVRKKLKPQDCAIEFVQYFGRHDEKRMGCLVLRSKGKPLFIDLFSTDSLLSLRLNTLHTVASAFEATKAEIKDPLYRDARLQQLIWSPRLMEAVGNANRIFFAPDGLIHQWAIEYIIPDSQKTCYRLSSTRNLLRRPSVPKLQSAIFCGGISYRAQYNPTQKNNDSIAYRYLKPIIGNINNLTFTKMEVDSIYACRHSPDDTLLIGEAATDEHLLQLLQQKNYDIVHFTTHGNFIGDINIRNDLRPLAKDISLSRCALFFAGSANTLNDDNFNDNFSDGVLSGAELAQQYFKDTELIVCNACQTGQGRLTDDGIYGLQRALKQAGANTIIVSLWNLYDYTSAVFLSFFYEELQRQATNKKDLHTAFLTARKRLMEHNVTKWGFDSATMGEKEMKYSFNAPQHINPFVIIDALP